MKVQIEISEETAALLFANNWVEKGGVSVEQIVTRLAEDEANDYRRHFPAAVAQAVADFRAANVE